MSYWKNKVVFLTGASSGIGESLALEQAKHGAILGLFARRANLLEEIVSKIETGGGVARHFPGDVTKKEEVFNAAEDLQREFGGIDIMIANAGVSGKSEKTRDFEPETLKKVIDINLIGAINSVSAVLPHMLKQKSGQLVAVSSLAGFRGLPKSAAYSASKAGMTTFFESIRLDVRRKGVSVTIIQPGFIKTPMTEKRAHKMPFLMELEDSIPYFLDAIERKKSFAAFPWQLAAIVRLGSLSPTWLYDRIVSKGRVRE